jgi:sulfopropanediol 3-dehydrogenase
VNETVAAVSDVLAPEQLEVQTAEDECYHGRLRNYGLIFLGFRATVAFSDTDVTGTNRVLPTRPRRPIYGRSVGRFLRPPLSYQRIMDDRAMNPMAEAVVAISHADGRAAHAATAAKRMQRPPASENRKQRSGSQLRAVLT